MNLKFTTLVPAALMTALLGFGALTMQESVVAAENETAAPVLDSKPNLIMALGAIR